MVPRLSESSSWRLASAASYTSTVLCAFAAAGGFAAACIRPSQGPTEVHSAV